VFQHPLPAQVSEEGAQGGELAGSRNLLEPLAVETGEKRSDQQVIHVLGPRCLPELSLEVLLELREVAGVGTAGVGRGVPLVGQVAKERAYGLVHR
jgi:hypothetical protein